MPAGNHGSCIQYLGLDVYFDEHNYHDSLQAHLMAIDQIKKNQSKYKNIRNKRILSTVVKIAVERKIV